MHSALKNFVVTFLIAALLFGIIGYFTTAYISGIITDILDGEKNKLSEIKSVETQSEGKPSSGDDLIVPDGESFTFLIIGSNFNPVKYSNYYYSVDQIKDIISKFDSSKTKHGLLASVDMRYVQSTWNVLIHGDKEKRTYVFSYISPKTMVSTPSGTLPLEDAYGISTIEEYTSYITSLTGMKIDHYFVIDEMNLPGVINSLGSISFSLTSGLYVDSDKNIVSFDTYMVTEEKDNETYETFDDSDETFATTAKETEKPDDDGKPKNTDIILNSELVPSGNVDLSENMQIYLNNFSEISDEDIEIKGKALIDIVKQYFKSLISFSADDLSWKIGDLSSWVQTTVIKPYEYKPLLATTFTNNDVYDYYSMFNAYFSFEVKDYVYPGSYSEKTGHVMPATTSALNYFSQYRKTGE